MKPDQSRLQRLDALAEKHTQSGEFSNIEWRVSHAGVLASRGLLGTANALDGMPLPPEPIYRIYSMTKPMVSVLALQLIEEGLLSLATPVAQFLPAVARAEILENGATRRASRVMTVEHLLTHRAGFSYDFLPRCDVGKLYRDAELAENGDRSLAELVDALIEQPLCSEPGTAWRYSYSTDVLARVLEIVTGNSLQNLLASYLFEPCGLRDTGFSVSPESQHRLMQMFGQRKLGEEMKLITDPQKLYAMDIESAHPVNSSTFARGGHGLYSTAGDYLRFMQVLVNGKTPDGDSVLSAPMVEMMWRNRIPKSQRPLAIGANVFGGYGWNLFGRVMIDTGSAMFLTGNGEGGWAGAASTYFWVDPVRQLNGVVMTQYLGGTVPIGDFFRSAAYQSLV